MKRLLYLDKDSKELENILNGKKDVVIRGANIKKYPFNLIHKGYRVYFMGHNDLSIIEASATVKEALFFTILNEEDRETLIKKYKDRTLLNKKKTNYILDRKYISVFVLEDVRKERLTLDNSLYGKVDDWMILSKVDSSDII